MRGHRAIQSLVQHADGHRLATVVASFAVRRVLRTVGLGAVGHVGNSESSNALLRAGARGRPAMSAGYRRASARSTNTPILHEISSYERLGDA